MKLKLVVIELQLTRPQKLAAALTVCGAGVALCASWASAAVPHSFTEGEVLTAANLMQNFADLDTRVTNAQSTADAAAADVADLQAQTHPASAFRAYRSTNIAVPSGTATPIVFDQEEFDIASEYDPATGTFTAKNAGVYLLTCSTWLATSPTPGAVWNVNIYGPDFAIGSDLQNSGAKGLSPTVVAIRQLDAGDQVSCSFYHDAGATQTINASFPERNAFSVARLY